MTQKSCPYINSQRNALTSPWLAQHGAVHCVGGGCSKRWKQCTCHSRGSGERNCDDQVQLELQAAVWSHESDVHTQAWRVGDPCSWEQVVRISPHRMPGARGFQETLPCGGLQVWRQEPVAVGLGRHVRVGYERTHTISVLPFVSRFFHLA